MRTRHSPSWLARLGLAPARKVMALDAGERCVKLVLAERVWKAARVLRRQKIDLEEEGLVSPEELNRHVEALIDEWGASRLVLPLPQHRVVSQLLDLPAAPPEEIERLIEEETVRLAGVSESAIIYDYVPLKPFGRHERPCRVTLCQESEIAHQLRRLGLPELNLAEVTTAGNALVEAVLRRAPDADRLIVADMGAASTTLAIFFGGQGVHTGSIPIGGELFTESVANRNRCPLEAAEALKRSKNFLTGPDSFDAFRSVASSWVSELDRVVAEWTQDHFGDEMDPRSLELCLSGGAALLPGWTDFLREQGRPTRAMAAAEGEFGSDSMRFAVAEGAALQALDQAVQPTSLLPRRQRVVWKRRETAARLLSAAAFALIATVIIGLGGMAKKWSLLEDKKELLRQADAILEQMKAAEEAGKARDLRYERIRPVLARQQDTLDALGALGALQEPAANRSLWCVLFADFQSYFTAPLPPPDAGTNGAPSTNLVGSVSTNSLRPPPPNYRRGFIAEVSGPQPPDPMRRTLGQMVVELNESPLFLNVDSLPAELERNLADPAVIAENRSYSLEMRLPANPFEIEAPRALPTEDREPANTGPKRPTFRDKSRLSEPSPFVEEP